MTAKRDSKRKPKKAAERPKIKKEMLKDLDPGTAASRIAGGRAPHSGAVSC